MYFSLEYIVKPQKTYMNYSLWINVSLRRLYLFRSIRGCVSRFYGVPPRSPFLCHPRTKMFVTAQLSPTETNDDDVTSSSSSCSLPREVRLRPTHICRKGALYGNFFFPFLPIPSLYLKKNINIENCRAHYGKTKK